jgi:hypothetical protein
MNKPILKKWKIATSFVSAILLILASSASAALVITGDTINNASGAIPPWPLATDSLIAGMLPSSSDTPANFQQSYGPYGTIAGLSALTDGVLPGCGATYDGSGQYATCGYDHSGGNWMIYTLPAAAHGYNITNISTFTTWGDNAVSGQAYALSYSTADNPTSFIYLGYVYYQPDGSGGMANRVQLTDSMGVIAANAVAIKFNFMWPPSSLGVNAYTEITVQGTPAATVTAPPVAMTTSNINQGGTFDPSSTWPVESPSLIAGQSPSDMVGDATVGGVIGVSALTDGALGITGDHGTVALLGSADGACSSLTYTLNSSVNGSDLTNIVVYTAWGDYGRDGQFYNISYSTVSAPTTFIRLTGVEFNPVLSNNGNGSACRVSFSPSTGVLAKNVSKVKFDFPANRFPALDHGNEPEDYGASAYQEIIIQGTNSLPPTLPPSPYLVQDTVPVYAQTVVGDQVIFTAAYSNLPPANLQWQFVSGGVTYDIPGATSPTLTLNNVQLTNSGSYRLKAVNATNSAAAPSYSTAATLLVGSVPAAVNNVIMSYAEQSSGATNFYPPWTIDTSSDLIYQFPIDGSGNPGTATAGTGNYGLNGALGDPNILDGADGGVLGDGLTTLVTCGRVDFGAGVSVTYYLNNNSPSAPNGFNLTNITVFGGWINDDANEQKYQVLYSTVAAPSTFVSLGTFDYKPADSSGYPSATRTVLIPTTGVLAHNVCAVQFNFNMESIHNWNGYSQITIGGQPSAGMFPALTQDIRPLTAEDVAGSSLILQGNFSGATGFQWQKNGTNLVGQTSTTLILTNLQLADTATNGGYALLGYNAVGTSTTRACAVIVDPVPAAVSNVVTAFAYQTSDGSAAAPFAPTWDTTALSSSLIYQQNPPAGGSAPAANFGGGGLPVLTDGNYGVFTYDGTTYPAFAGCGPSAGQYVIYTLGANANGYDVTNIQIASGWGDNGRNSQYYTVLYSTPLNPTTFTPIKAVQKSPTLSNQNVIRTTMTPAAGVLASNVYAIEVDFTQPTGVPNGWSGYSEISVFGAPSATPPTGTAYPLKTATYETVSTPDWGVASPNLIAGQLPSSYDTGAGDSFTDGSNGGLPTLTDGVIGTATGLGASCGGTGQGGGTFITYTPTNGSWTLTNIVVYTGWGDYGRPGQFYDLSYSTMAAPTTFLPLASVVYNPSSYNGGSPWATRVTISPGVGQTVLATNVAAVHFDFTPQGSLDYGWSSYTEIVLQGTNEPSAVVPTLPTTFASPKVSGGNLILTGTGGTPNAGYTWLTTTNLSAPIIWTTNVQGVLDGSGNFSNSIPIGATPASFFRFRIP